MNPLQDEVESRAGPGYDRLSDIREEVPMTKALIAILLVALSPALAPAGQDPAGPVPAVVKTAVEIVTVLPDV